MKTIQEIEDKFDEEFPNEEVRLSQTLCQGTSIGMKIDYIKLNKRIKAFYRKEIEEMIKKIERLEIDNGGLERLLKEETRPELSPIDGGTLSPSESRGSKIPLDKPSGRLYNVGVH
jgi:hypothetical protein